MTVRIVDGIFYACMGLILAVVAAPIMFAMLFPDSMVAFLDSLNHAV